MLSTGALEADGTLPASIFGPKKKFRPVVQRPAPKDTSLHSALMEAIHSAGGKDRLRKVKLLVGFCLRDGLSPTPTQTQILGDIRGGGPG